jgi:hypothetical protein
MAFGALAREWEQGQDYISLPSNSEQRVERKPLIRMPQKKLSPNTEGVGGFVFVRNAYTGDLEPSKILDDPAVCLTNLQSYRGKLYQAKYPSCSINPFIDDWEKTQTINLFSPNGLGSWVQLSEELAKRIPSSSPLPLVQEFNPSDKLARFLVAGSGEYPLTTAEAKKRLKRFVRSFIGSIADSLEGRHVPCVQLTENGKFRDNVARALIHRFPVGVYEQGDFLTALLDEIIPVARSRQFCTISGMLIEAGGELVVKPTGHKAPPLLPDAPWVKATTPGN